MSRPIFLGQGGAEARPVPAPDVVGRVSARRLTDSLAGLGPAQPLPPPSRPAPAASAAPPTETHDFVDALARASVVSPLAGLHVAAPSPSADTFPLDEERPPMIIERAIAERIGAATLSSIADQPAFRAWPGLLAGFSIALACGMALYAVLTMS